MMQKRRGLYYLQADLAAQCRRPHQRVEKSNPREATEIINELAEFSAALALHLRDEITVHQSVAHFSCDPKERLRVARYEPREPLLDRLRGVRPVGRNLVARATVKGHAASRASIRHRALVAVLLANVSIQNQNSWN